MSAYRAKRQKGTGGTKAAPAEETSGRVVTDAARAAGIVQGAVLEKAEGLKAELERYLELLQTVTDPDAAEFRKEATAERTRRENAEERAGLLLGVKMPTKAAFAMPTGCDWRRPAGGCSGGAAVGKVRFRRRGAGLRQGAVTATRRISTAVMVTPEAVQPLAGGVASRACSSVSNSIIEKPLPSAGSGQ
ncbi:hypothetical protein ABZ070_35340 [Streptomyces sp. NPDC006283]|uniref:hypothetical protein n=1 Tax=Streptomyces sp. NPDC006283 TaxID=3156741 RepID=UPI0033A89CB3